MSTEMKSAYYDRFVVQDDSGNYLADDDTWTDDPAKAAEYDTHYSADVDAVKKRQGRRGYAKLERRWM